MELNEVGSVSSEKELEREDSGKNYLILHGGRGSFFGGRFF